MLPAANAYLDRCAVNLHGPELKNHLLGPAQKSLATTPTPWSLPFHNPGSCGGCAWLLTLRNGGKPFVCDVNWHRLAARTYDAGQNRKPVSSASFPDNSVAEGLPGTRSRDWIATALRDQTELRKGVKKRNSGERDGPRRTKRRRHQSCGFFFLKPLRRNLPLASSGEGLTSASLNFHIASSARFRNDFSAEFAGLASASAG